MYEGGNPTAVQSIEWLKNGLLSLMKEKLYNKISVKEICQRASLARQTFYNFFDQKDDIIRFYLKKYLCEIWAEDDKKTTSDLSEEIGSKYFRVFEEHHEMFTLLIEHQLDYILFEEITEIIIKRLEREPMYSDRNKYAYQIAFLSGGMTSMVIHWMKDKDRMSDKEFEQVLRNMFNGSFVNAVTGRKQ